MEDNFYKVDAVSIRENQENRVAVVIAQIEQKPITTSLAFVKSISETPKIKDRKTEVDIQPLIWIMLVKIAALSGVKDTIDDFNKSDILKMIFTSFSDLTVEEIYKSFELERYSQYEAKTEHFQLFNAEYVSTILKKYKQWRTNVKILHNLTAGEVKTEQKDQEAIDKILIRGIVDRYDHYITTKEMITPFAHLFDYLYEKNIIKKPTTPALESYYAKVNERAKEQIREELSSKKAISREEKRDFAKQFNEVINGNSNNVLVRAKRIVLSDFFNDVYLNGKDLEKILNAGT
jgi:hypothetical protein